MTNLQTANFYFYLMEFFRFSDGAHCCLASDPNVSGQYGAGIYEREMSGYLINATSFWWQFTTDVRSAKQIGWLENWFGVDENNGICLAPSEKKQRILRFFRLTRREDS